MALDFEIDPELLFHAITVERLPAPQPHDEADAPEESDWTVELADVPAFVAATSVSEVMIGDALRSRIQYVILTTTRVEAGPDRRILFVDGDGAEHVIRCEDAQNIAESDIAWKIQGHEIR